MDKLKEYLDKLEFSGCILGYYADNILKLASESGGSVSCKAHRENFIESSIGIFEKQKQAKSTFLNEWNQGFVTAMNEVIKQLKSFKESVR